MGESQILWSAPGARPIAEHIAVYTDASSDHTYHISTIGYWLPVREEGAARQAAHHQKISVIELNAVLWALISLAHQNIPCVQVYTDSQDVIDTLFHPRLKSKFYKEMEPLVRQVQRAAARFESVKVKRVPREKNSGADRMAHACLERLRKEMVKLTLDE